MYVVLCHVLFKVVPLNVDLREIQLIVLLLLVVLQLRDLPDLLSYHFLVKIDLCLGGILGLDEGEGLASEGVEPLHED